VSVFDDVTARTGTEDPGPPSLRDDEQKHLDENVPPAAHLLWVSPLLVAAAATVCGFLLLRSGPASRLAPAAFVASASFFIFGSTVLFGVMKEDGLRTEEVNTCKADCADLYWALSAIKDPALMGLAWVNYKQLRTFTIIAQRQARMSYYASVTAASIAMLVLASGAAVAVCLPSTTARVTAGTLAAAGAALSAFFTQTFLRTYQMASRQMSYYYGQPLVHCYLLHAQWLAMKTREHLGSEAELRLWHEVIDATIQASAHAQHHLLTMQQQCAKCASPGHPDT